MVGNMRIEESFNKKLDLSEKELDLLIEFDEKDCGVYSRNKELKKNPSSIESLFDLLYITMAYIRDSKIKEEFELGLKTLVYILQKEKENLNNGGDPEKCDSVLSEGYFLLANIMFKDRQQIGPFFELGQKFGLEQSDQKALDYLYETLKYDFNFNDVYYLLGSYYATFDTYYESLKAYNAFVRIKADYKNKYWMEHIFWDANRLNDLGYNFEAVYEDFERAFVIYQKAYDIDHNDLQEGQFPSSGYIIYNLAHCYLDGIGVEKDIEKAKALAKECKDVFEFHKEKYEDPDNIFERLS